MCQMPGQSSGNMSNGLARDVVGMTLFRNGRDPSTLKDRLISESGGGSGRPAATRQASRPTSSSTVLGGTDIDQRRAASGFAGGSKTLLGQ